MSEVVSIKRIRIQATTFADALEPKKNTGGVSPATGRRAILQA